MSIENFLKNQRDRLHIVRSELLKYDLKDDVRKRLVKEEEILRTAISKASRRGVDT